MTAAEVVHAVPEDDSPVTQCCGRTPFELSPKSRMTTDPALVTCGGQAVTAVPVRSATIEITITLELGAAELFPDGAPDEWDAGTVLAEIQESRTAARFLDDWDALTFGCHVAVDVGTTSARCDLP